MISKDLLKKVILEQQELFKEDFINRESLNVLNEKSISDFILIISGIRRCGKSTLLHMFKEGQKDKNYYLNFDDERLNDFEISDFEKLYEVFIELYGKENSFYFDEIQNILGWEKFVRRLNDYKSKVYITGSNANLLSKELGTHLTGRYIQLELYPISFREFLEFKLVKINKNDLSKREKVVMLQKLFNEYLEKGGFLKYLKTNEKEFFKNLYDSIIYRDIITRYKLTNEKPIKDMFYYLVSNISKEFSYTTLKSISNISSITTIKDYLSYMENSYLLFSVSIYDNSLKKQYLNPKKIYVIDTGFANSISFKFSEDRGRVLENLVFIELKRRGKEIYYHKAKKECDFLIREELEIKFAIQVCKSLDDIDTKNREVQGLLEAMITHNLKTGLILTEDEESIEMHLDKKIVIMPIWKWLLER